MIGRLNHVAIAVPDLEAAADQYRNALGANVGPAQDEPDHGVTVIFIELPIPRSNCFTRWVTIARSTVFWKRTLPVASITSAMRSKTSSRRGIA